MKIKFLPHSLRSLRVRLTLMNIFVLALILCALALVLRPVVARSLVDSIDTDLKVRARRARHMASFVAAKSAQKKEQAASKPSAAPSPDRSMRPGQGDTTAPSQWQTRFVEKWFAPNGERLFGPAGERPLDPAALTQAAQGKELFTTARVSGEAVRVFSAPLLPAEESEQYNVVQEGYSLIDVERAQANLDRALLMLVPIGLCAAGAGGLFLTERMLRPVREATREAGSIGADDLSRRLPVEGSDEFSELTITLNEMLSRLESSFEQQKRFTADASHELRTPLTVIKSASSRVLSRRDLPPDLQRVMERIDRAAGGMGHIIEDLLLLARSDAKQLDLQLRLIALYDFLDDVLADVSVGDGPAIENRIDRDRQLTLSGDPRHLSRLFINLIENALHHTPPGGLITLDARRAKETVIVSIADTGMGIAPEHLPHVTERFYRADAARTRAHGGTGLGLAICQTIAEAHGGTLQMESEVGKGTMVSVTLPVCHPS